MVPDNKLTPSILLLLVLALGSFIFLMAMSEKHDKIEKKPNYTRHYLHFR